jgi:hypothetical protein
MSPPPPAPPPGLACLARHYPLTPVWTDKGWVGQLPDGTQLAWDDGRPRTFDEKLDAPDLRATLSIPYRPGPIAPVTAENDDPGRIRVDALFRAAYGATRDQVKARLVPLTLFGEKLAVHPTAAPAFARVEARLLPLVAHDPSLKPFLTHLGGTFVWRTIAHTQRMSAHSYGVSLDLNVERSHYWEWQKPRGTPRWQNAVPQAIVDAFEAEGFIWGGRWWHYDTMHFEYRPELLDPGCREP